MAHALLTAKEAAEILFGSRSRKDYKAILALIHAGQLPHLKQKGKYYVWRKPLEAYL
jgi:hypothetical protein